MRFVLSLVVILGLAMVSQATIVQTIGNFNVDVTLDTAAPASTGLKAYVFTLINASGLSAVDGRVDAVDTYLNQSWPMGSMPTPTVEGAGSAYALLTATQKRDDTHINVSLTKMTVARAPDENFVAFNPPPGVQNGHGTTLCGYFNAGTEEEPYNDWSKTMAFGFTGMTQYTSIIFSRVVVDASLAEVTLVRPVGSPYVEWNFRLVDRVAAPGTGSATFDIFLAVPEPMTLSLLGAGALALIRRRR